MKNQLYRTLVIIVILLTVLAACAPSAPAATTEAPKPTATTAPTAEPTKPPLPTNTSAPATPKNAVTSLEDVKNATVQIESDGTFIDPQVGMVVNGAGRGSGFIIDPSGIAVTNNHVVTGAALLKVWVGGNKDKVYSAKVLGASECSDLAVIKINGSDFPYLQWHEGTPNVGLDIYAAGYPLGDPEFTLTKGIVSKAKADGNTNWASIGSVIEHDARINPGNSGGPLVDKDGKVVGINFASNSSNQYFAIARAEADQVLKDLEAGNDVTSIGVNGQVIITEDKKLSGVWVSSVKSGTPADKAGLKAGDIIVQLEGLVLGTDGTMSDYCQILRSHKATDTLTLNVLRWQTQEILEGQLNGRQLTVTGTYGSTGSSSTPQSGSSTTKVTDDSNVISMEVPSDWEYDGSAWKNTWNIGGGSYDFTAQTLTASPNVKNYSNGWGTKGIFIATSRDWANIGGYNNLLVGVSSFYSECQPATAKNYNDGTYEGQSIVYTRCGTPKTNALVLAVRPISDPQAYLVLVEMKFATDAELNELDTILSSATINP
ncbi:MAG TPA: trypsin-like peptidase domain-containing protein [Anaerolineaceae bacterium]|nr:trypsin-like peptidase domain-containing protein [Anaerolineaceae bacterium]